MSYRLVKRGLDLIVASVLLLVLSPFILILLLGVLLIDRNNPIFIQERAGQNEEVFGIIKVRTMRENNGSKEVTIIGKVLRLLHLDELLQLINVIKGDMSFVGPRPLLPKYNDLMTTEQKSRFKVKPGITGWAQIQGGNALSWEDRFMLDIEYVWNQSFYLDLKIVIRTPAYLIQSSHKRPHDSEEFKGSRN